MTIVADQTTGEVIAEIVPPVPMFEGKHVDAAALKIVSSSVMDLADVVLGVDDIIKIEVEARVMDVRHTVHEQSGRLIRLQIAKPYTARVVPFNPTYDDGVDRADG